MSSTRMATSASSHGSAMRSLAINSDTSSSSLMALDWGVRQGMTLSAHSAISPCNSAISLVDAVDPVGVDAWSSDPVNVTGSGAESEVLDEG